MINTKVASPAVVYIVRDRRCTEADVIKDVINGDICSDYYTCDQAKADAY